jgi:hypothetical protein
MNRLAYIFIIPFLAMCQTDKRTQLQERQSRIEQIKARPYRNLGLTDNQERTITNYIQEVIKLTKTLGELKLFYVTDSSNIIEIKKDWNSAKQVTETSYEV